MIRWKKLQKLNVLSLHPPEHILNKVVPLSQFQLLMVNPYKGTDSCFLLHLQVKTNKILTFKTYAFALSCTLARMFLLVQSVV